MVDATAKLKNYRQSPRKVRIVADLIRGKTVDHALALLATLPKRVSLPLAKLVKAGVANSKMQPNELVISTIQVNGGVVLKRSMPRARGRASQILKRTSHITLGLSRKVPKVVPAAK
jgi:large subunit ribosomal protein L22